MINDQGDIAIIIEEHPDTPGQYFISAYQPLQSDVPTEQDISNSYLSACNIPDSEFDFNQLKYLLVPEPLHPSRLLIPLRLSILLIPRFIPYGHPKNLLISPKHRHLHL